MPIRFRCAYCNQLLGIARRKAGTVVRCPNCAGQVVVPVIEGDDEPEAPEPSPVPPEAPPKPASAAAPQPIFERSDFDEILKPAPSREPAGKASGPVVSPSAPPSPHGTMQAQDDPGVNVERVPLQPALIPTLEPMAPQPGIWLSPAKATLLSVLVVLALTLTFVLGLMVGILASRP